MTILQVGLTASGTSPVFRMGNGSDFWVMMRSGGGTGFNGGTITMQFKPDAAGGFASYVIDGSTETWTGADKRRYIDGSGDFQFVADASISDVDIWVHGAEVLSTNA